ncbi:MAG: hypothetical protein ACLUG4_07425 [Bacilli bacterium]
MTKYSFGIVLLAEILFFLVLKAVIKAFTVVIIKRIDANIKGIKAIRIIPRFSDDVRIMIEINIEIQIIVKPQR